MPSDLSASLLMLQGIPAVPGGLWSLLAKLAWSDPDLVRFHALHFAATAGGGAGAVEDTADVSSKHYFIVRRITGYVEQDPGAAASEAFAAQDVTLQIEDRENSYELFESSIAMSDLAGVGGPNGTTGGNPVPTPIECDEFPLVFLPRASVLATFTPNADFPNGAHSVTGATTRKVKATLYGALVHQDLVDKLLDMNAEALRGAGLLGARSKR